MISCSSGGSAETAPKIYCPHPAVRTLSDLLLRSEVSLFGSHLVASVGAEKIDGTIPAVILEIRRSVDQRVLAAQLFFDVVKTVRHHLDRRWKERLPAGLLGHLGQRLVALAAAGGPVGADGIDDGLC